MLKKFFQAAIVKKIAARTPLGAAVVVGGTVYMRHRRNKQAEQAAGTRA
jgi:hypothetical protein